MEKSFIDDAALTSMDDDKFNRTNFIEHLFKSIVAYPQEECLVLGLIGNWGFGKTSIVNAFRPLIEEYNSKAPFADLEIGIIEFSPWGLDDSSAMANHFFDTLCEDISKMHRSKKIARKIAKVSNEYMKSIGSLPNPLAAISGAAISTLTTISSDEGMSPSECKSRLQELLNDTERRYLVVIDDIDRLSDSSVCSLFRLIASVADFPTSRTYFVSMTLLFLARLTQCITEKALSI